MIAELLTVGTMGIASGIAAITFFWKKNGNGKHEEPQAPPAQVEVKWPPGAEEAFQKLANPPMLIPAQPAWPEVVEELERIAECMLVASRETKPEWATQIESDLAENDRRLERIAENMADGMARFYSQVSRDLAVDLSGLVGIADKLDSIVHSIPDLDPRAEVTQELTRQLADLPTRIGRSVSDTLVAERKKNPPPPPEKNNKGNNSPPPPPSAPRALPPLDANNQTVVPPVVPAPYVAGMLFVPAGSVWNVLYLIQKLLNQNCPGTSASFMISASGGSILVGTSSPIAGPLSSTNFAYTLDDTTPPRYYYSSFPGNDTPVGELQVFSTAGGYLHVEVQS